MTETRAERVVRLAEWGVERAAGERRPFTITKLSRHEDGYWHARITPAGGRPVYIHRRYGSWMAPGKLGKREVLKDVMPQVAAELQRQVTTLEYRERKEARDDNGQADAQADSEDAR